jgi:hypothetical protein
VRVAQLIEFEGLGCNRNTPRMALTAFADNTREQAGLVTHPVVLHEVVDRPNLGGRPYVVAR